MNTTKSRIGAKGLNLQIEQLEAQFHHLEKVDGISSQAMSVRLEEINRLKSLRTELLKKAFLEDLTVYQTSQRKNGKVYQQYQASWKVNGRTKTVYLGRVSKISHQEALRLARRLKAASAGIEEVLPQTRPERATKKPTKVRIELTSMVAQQKPSIGRGIIGDDDV